MNVLSLFSGAGGMDLGFEGNFKVSKFSIDALHNSSWIKKEDSEHFLLESTQFKTIFANDIRADAMRVWTHHFGKTRDVEGIYHLNSIVDLVQLEEMGQNIFPRNVDIVTGGFPCNDFPVSGKRRGFNSTVDDKGNQINTNNKSVANRGQLYSWMKKVVDIVRPKMFVAENVKGLLNMKNALTVIQNEFSSIGNGSYLLIPARIMNTWEYGVSQSRERLIILGLIKLT